MSGDGPDAPDPAAPKRVWVHKLYALDTPLPGLGAGATKAELERAMKGHVLESAELIGTYEATPSRSRKSAASSE